MFTYGEPLSKKSDLELEVLAYLDLQLERLEDCTLDCSTTYALAREIMDSDFLDLGVTEPFVMHPRGIENADPWIYYHWKDLATFDFALSPEFEDLISEPKFAQEWYNPIANPRSYKLFVYEQTLTCLLSAPELEFLVDEQARKLEVTPDVISEVRSLSEEHLTKIEQLLSSPLAKERIKAERLCDNWRYPLNPEMSALDRLAVLVMGHECRGTYKVYDGFNLPFDIANELTQHRGSVIQACNDDPWYVYEAIATVATDPEHPLLLETVKALPKEDIERLIRNINSPIVADTLREKLSEHALDHSSNSLSDLAQEARSASDALNKESNNRLDREHEER